MCHTNTITHFRNQPSARKYRSLSMVYCVQVAFSSLPRSFCAFLVLFFLPSRFVFSACILALRTLKSFSILFFKKTCYYFSTLICEIRRSNMVRLNILFTLMLLLRCTFVWAFQPPLRLAPSTTHRGVLKRRAVLLSVNGEHSSQRRSFVDTIDQAGLSLKPRAQMTDSKAKQAPSRLRKFLLRAQACLLYSLFILYRGYRGFFVIIPAVFREVYLKLEASVDPSPFGAAEANAVKWQTRITVAIMATVLTASYIVGGFLRVMTKLVKTIFQTSDIAHSFEEAASEQEVNEDRVKRLAQKMRLKNGDSSKPSSKSDTDIDDGPAP